MLRYYEINIANITKNENIENIQYFQSRKYRIYVGYISPIYIMDIYRANPAVYNQLVPNLSPKPT